MFSTKVRIILSITQPLFPKKYNTYINRCHSDVSLRALSAVNITVYHNDNSISNIRQFGYKFLYKGKYLLYLHYIFRYYNLFPQSESVKTTINRGYF